MPQPNQPPSLKLPRKRGARARISLTPLIDVVFILLVFFMLASNFMDWRAIRLDAPAEAGGDGGDRPAVLLRIGAGGGLDLNGEPIADGGLTGAITPLTQRQPEPTVLIRPADGVPLQRAVSVLDRVEAAGINRARLMRGN
jgi:biopolymer transport protein ExbD